MNILRREICFRNLLNQLFYRALLYFVCFFQVAYLRSAKVNYRLSTLPSSEVAELLIKNGLEPNRLLGLIMSCYNGTDEARLVLAEFSLNNGANPDLLLEIATNQSWQASSNNFHSARLQKQGDFIKMALERGAKFSDISIDNGSYLLSIEAAEIMLKNSLDPNDLVILVMRASCEDYNQEKQTFEVNDKLVEQRSDLIRMALEKGADANLLLKIAVNQSYRNKDIELHHLFLQRQEDVIKIALERGAGFSNIKIENYTYFPSPEAVEIMFKNSINPNMFLKLILGASCEKYNNEKHSREISNELVERKISLVKLAFEKGANAQEIKYLSALPSPEISELLLENGMNPDSFITLLSHVFCVKSSRDKDYISEVDGELIKQRGALVGLAVKKGAHFQKIDDSRMISIVELFNTIVSLGIDNVKANIDLMSTDGKTALMLAAEGEYAEIAEFLIMEGADINKKDKEGNTAFMLANKNGEMSDNLREILRSENAPGYEDL